MRGGDEEIFLSFCGSLITHTTRTPECVLCVCVCGKREKQTKLCEKLGAAKRNIMRPMQLLTATMCVVHPRCSSSMCIQDPYTIIGVARGTPLAEVRRVYRQRARELHPDTRTEAFDGTIQQEFQNLVDAYQRLASIKPGSRESHPEWHNLSVLEQYWSRELGYDTSADLEDWLIDKGYYDDEDESENQGLEAVPCEATISEKGISKVLAFRRFKGNDQWLVEWLARAGSESVGVGGAASDSPASWERFELLDTAELRDAATAMRPEQGGRSTAN